MVIVGGGNSAGQAAVALAGTGHQVHLAVRRPALADTMSTYLLDRIARDERICVHAETAVSDLSARLTSTRLRVGGAWHRR